MEYKCDYLVICSTLNQITNYLVIKNFDMKTENIFNITFKDDSKFSMGIEPKKWDDNLKDVMGEIPESNKIKLENNEIYDLNEIGAKLEKIINGKDNKDIYWHITGGQRIITLAISSLLQKMNRINDKILYIEGNTEKLIVNNSINEYEDLLNYGYSDLTFEEAFKLVGFTNGSDKRSFKFKEKGKKLIDEKYEEYNFYTELYEKIADTNKQYKISFENNDYTGTFRDLLLISNKNQDDLKTQENKKEFIFKVIDILGITSKYDFKSKDEMKQQYIAGYLFEKITAFQIYNEIKDNSKVIGMEASLKTFKDGITHSIDELDIVLLTNTGKIINFECKSGGMSGDNAKSHNYTTYRLNGVFGMPILLSPLYKNEKEDKINKNFLESAFEARRSAKRAELKTICINEIQEEIKNLLGVL